jgi:hypothetical protein
MPIVPDTKNWTWVLERACPECGFDASTLAPDDVAPLIGTNAEGWSVVLGASPDRLRRRVTDDRWSPLEYACHVRDVFVIFETRLQLMLTEDDPTFANWDQDRTAVEDRYNEQDPVRVRADLMAAASVLATSFAGVDGDAWQRWGSRSDGVRLTVDHFGRYMIHDPVHHLAEVTTDLATLGAID